MEKETKLTTAEALALSEDMTDAEMRLYWIADHADRETLMLIVELLRERKERRGEHGGE